MVAKAQTNEVTEAEKRLMRVGEEKFNLAQGLDGGRDFLDAVAGRDSSGREEEELRSEQAFQLGNIAAKDNLGLDYIDSRVASNAGVAAKGAAEEDKFSAQSALLNADLGIDSSVSSSLRSTAQSKAQLSMALAKAENDRRNQMLDVAGSVAGGATVLAADGGLFSSTDPLANPNQEKPDYSTAYDAKIQRPSSRYDDDIFNMLA